MDSRQDKTPPGSPANIPIYKSRSGSTQQSQKAAATMQVAISDVTSSRQPPPTSPVIPLYTSHSSYSVIHKTLPSPISQRPSVPPLLPSTISTGGGC